MPTEAKATALRELQVEEQQVEEHLQRIREAIETLQRLVPNPDPDSCFRLMPVDN